MLLTFCRSRQRARQACGAASVVMAALFSVLPESSALADDVAVIGAPLTQGRSTRLRPEVGHVLINGGACTGTLVAPQWVLTASHCTGHLNLYFVSGQSGGEFIIDHLFGGTSRYEVEHALSFGYPLGHQDLMLPRLRTAVPLEVARPATLAATYPAHGANISLMGYGGNSNATVSGKQYVNTTLRFLPDMANKLSTAAPEPLRGGDSGGPMFAQALQSLTAEIVGVNSGNGPRFGDVVQHRRALVAAIAPGVSPIGDVQGDRSFCGAGGALHYGDVDGNGELDALCHRPLEGAVQVAIGQGRVIQPRPHGRFVGFSGSFCAGPENGFHVGDFNGDGRTDILCANMRTGEKRVALSTGIALTPYPRVDYVNSDRLCSHAGAELHIGDFNGDRRSDLLCHDPRTGAKWIDLADVSPVRLFSNHDVFSGDRWCSHGSARLHVADFDGDGRTDLLCHTRDSGALDVRPNNGADWLDRRTWWSDHEVGFCRGQDLRIYDFTGNGRADLLCPSGGWAGGGTVLIAHGAETPFAPAETWTRGAWDRGFDRPWRASALAASPWPRPRG